MKKRVISAGVAMFDLDDFKLANDTYGHDIGDRILKTEVSVILNLIRKTDSLVRIGGDEFLLVMPGISQDNFDGKLREIRRRISSAEVSNSHNQQITVSIGGVMAKNEAICDVAARADRYMYQAKTHKNSISTEWGIIEMPEHAVLSAGKKKSDQCILALYTQKAMRCSISRIKKVRELKSCMRSQ